MPTTLDATFQAGTSWSPARVLLEVTGAPTVSPLYTSNFATVDGWTAASGTVAVYNGKLDVFSTDNTIGTFSRTVTGLTIASSYRFTIRLARYVGLVSIGVSGMTFSAYTSTPPSPTYTTLTYDFTATATSHVIQVKTKEATPSNLGGQYVIESASVTRTSAWGGTTIWRTDANGTNVVVREAPGGQDATGTTGSGVMAVTDYEAALVGPVDYIVTDGNGGWATASVAEQAAPGVWLALPATSNPQSLSMYPVAPAFVPVELVTDYSESAESNGTVHEIIGRADPVANPGPLALRSGSLSLWCSDYATAAGVRQLLAAGDVAQIRQPDYPGMDLYLYATGVSLAPADATATTRRWIATVDYQEVAAP